MALCKSAPKYVWGKYRDLNRHVVCLSCGQDFLVFPSRLKEKPKYCSLGCRNKAYLGRTFWSSERISLTCNYCNREFTVTPSCKNRKFCSRSCADGGRVRNRFWLGRKRDFSTIEKIRNKLMGRTTTWSKDRLSAFREKVAGENNVAWRGGVTPINRAIRVTLEYEEWRRKVLKRDNYTCQICNKIGGFLEADHIRPLSQIIKDTGVKNSSEAYLIKDFWDVDNGRTLCHDCHLETDTWGARALSFDKKEEIL